MKVKILFLGLFVFFLLVVDGFIARNPWIYGLGILSFGILYSTVTTHFTYKKIREASEKQTASLKEAGAALTDTLKVLFDNLKKLNTEKTRLQSKLAALDTRTHNLEQYQRKPVVIPKQIRDTAVSINPSSNRRRNLVAPPPVVRDKPPPLTQPSPVEKTKYTDAVNTQKQP